MQANTVNQNTVADDKKRNIFLFLSSVMTKREKYSSHCHRCTRNVDLEFWNIWTLNVKFLYNLRSSIIGYS